MSYQEKYLKYKSKYLNLKAEIHNKKLENKVFQNGGSNNDILNIDQLSGTATVSEKHFFMLGGSNTNSDELPDHLTDTPNSDTQTSNNKTKKNNSGSSGSSESSESSKSSKSSGSSGSSESSGSSGSSELKSSKSKSSKSKSSESSESKTSADNQSGGNKKIIETDSELLTTESSFLSFSSLNTDSSESI